MLSRARVHQLETANGGVKNNWYSTITAETIRTGSVSSDETQPTTTDNAVSIVPENFEKETNFADTSFEGSVLALREAPSTKRTISGAMSTISKRDVSSLAGYPLYDTQAIWKHSPLKGPASGLPVDLNNHIQKALDRYVRLAGQPLDFKRSVTFSEFLHMVTNERLRYMPLQGSRLDKVLKKAEAFAKKFDAFISAIKLVDISNTESAALVLSSCKLLMSFAQKHTVAIERFFSVLDQATVIMVQMAQKVDAETCSESASSILESALAMLVDIVVDITATFKCHRSNGSEKTIISHFESRFEVVLTRLTQLKAEFHMQVLSRWIELHSSKESLLFILRGFDFGLDTCPPSYLHILVDICLSLQSHGEDAETLKWYQLLWRSLETHRYECDIATERWFEVFQEYVAVLGLHEQQSERLRIAEEFRATILTDFGASSHFYVRVSIELAKLLELDSVRYTEAVTIFEEICQYELHMFEEREAITALIEIAKYRLSILLETHIDLAHRAESLLIDAFTSAKLQFGCSDDKVLIALTRIIEYYGKQKRRDNITAATQIMEEYIIELLVEERNEIVLFNIARAVAKMYRELSSVEFGIKFLHLIKEEVTFGEKIAGDRCGFKHDQLASLDRRCLVFIHVLEQLLCGYEREGMLNEIIRDIFTESCLYEAWLVSLRKSKSIHVRLAAGARLLAFLEGRGRQSEIRRLRTEMWEMFRGFSSRSTDSESLWQLFELSLANATQKTVSISMLELLVNVTLEFFTAKEFEVSLQLLQWSQVYFEQLRKVEHSRVIELAFKISGSFSGFVGKEKYFVEINRISSEILVEVLKFAHRDVDFSSVPVGQLNVVVRLLGEQRNFSMLERIFQHLWDTRMSRDWSGTTTVATGRRLCEVKFAAGHHASAITLIESICYNLRDVYGDLHQLTVECETLRASFHNTCGNHSAARDIHAHLLEQIAGMNSEAAIGRQDLVDLTMDQAKRLKWAYHQRGQDDDEQEFYSRILRNAQKSVNQLSLTDVEEMRKAMAMDGEKQETKWKMPEDWSLPIESEG
ncbi:hypothetical protein F5Y03DRAFT_403281 [Xylaria venustula]|nr:hypothetical protein F5Y03DRAFT_403281 [Xylaria venustula]